MEVKTAIFKDGIVNYPNDPELVPRGGASDSLGWITKGAFIEFSKGKSLIGASEAGGGPVRGHHFAYKTDGTAVQYRKINTKIQYYNTATSLWVDVITGLTASAQYTFANYTSLAGSFVFISGYDGLYKINVANPGSYLNLTDETINFKHPGKILISDSRMFMWDLENDKSALYLSWIDSEAYISQSLVVYGTGNGSSTTITGTITPYNPTSNILAVEAYGPIGTLKTVSNVTKATQGVVTATAHGFSTGDYVVFSNFFDFTAGAGTVEQSGNTMIGVGTSFTTTLKVGSLIAITGNVVNTVTAITDDTHIDVATFANIPSGTYSYYSMKQLNKVMAKITVTDANNFTIPINTTAYQSYSSGGKVAKAEYFIDNNNGTLTSNYGGTGTINYVTGAISTTFSQAPINAESTIVNYQVETPSGGITDFSYSTPRQAGQGDVFRQDEGGDAIQKVENFEGIYYSIKERSVYQLTLTANDTNATNTMFRRNIGMPYFRASISTGQGIVFMDTANPDQPKLTRLERNIAGTGILPVELAPQFDFSKYNWDSCSMEGIGEYIVFTGKTLTGSTNDRLFLYSLKWKSVDVLPFNADTLAKNAGLLYIGGSDTDNVYNVFNGYSTSFTNQWTSGADLLNSEEYKRVRRLTLEGDISSTQSIQVYMSLDGDTFALVGTIAGNGAYVDTTNPRTVGSLGLGEGGGTQITVYPYMLELKINSGKFYRRRLKFITTSTGYASVSTVKDKDILGYGDKIPRKFRTN